MASRNKSYKNSDITVYWKPSSCIHASTCVNELPGVFRSNKRPWIDMEGASTEEIIKVVNRCPVDALMWKWNDESKNADPGVEHTNHIKNMQAGVQEESPRIEKDKARSGNDESAPVIRTLPDGPFVINGTFFLERENGSRSRFDGTVSLCRCGKSRLQPFCDGSHRKKEV
jgi:uncharacterized Fe-S cluster protein YjdI